jgi:hypothetical protein
MGRSIVKRGQVAVASSGQGERPSNFTHRIIVLDFLPLVI